jgi:hypothetical protein
MNGLKEELDTLNRENKSLERRLSTQKETTDALQVYLLEHLIELYHTK